MTNIQKAENAAREKGAKFLGEHTPTPWKCYENRFGGFSIAKENNIGLIDIGGARELNDAAFIVRAVNAYGPMLAIIEDIVGRFNEQMEHGDEINGADLVDYFAQFLFPEAQKVLKAVRS